MKYLDEVGLKRLWRRFANDIDSINYEFVNITINNNHGETYNNLDFVININGSETTYTYKGVMMTVKVPRGTTYTVILPDKSGYLTPTVPTYTATGGVTNTLNLTYNSCILTFNINNSAGRADVTWGGNTYQVTNGETMHVPYGETVTVKGTKVAGYKPNKIEPFTTSTATKTVSVVYDVFTTEVKIMDGSGNLVDVNSWTSSKGVTGVTLVTEDIEIVIAPNEWCGKSDGSWNGNSRSAWGGYGKLLSDVTADDNIYNCIVDFIGLSNTNQIIRQLAGTTDSYSSYYTGAPAAEYCRSYSKGCKAAGQWYLPAMGELQQLMSNRDKINEAMTKISGELFEYNSCWSSTQKDSNISYFMDFDDSMPSSHYKYQDTIGVRPICQIEDTTGNIITFKINGVSYLGEDQMTWSQWVSSSYNTAGFKITSSKLYTSAGVEVKLNNSSVSSSSKPVSSGIYTTSSVKVLLNSQWRASSKSNPDSSIYGIYESYSNKGSSSKAAIMYIDIDGLTEFTCYIRSYAESSYDYVMIGQLDQALTNDSSYSNSTLVKAHTRGNQQSGTALSSYTKVTYTGIDGGAHRIYVVYRKDGSVDNNDDRGYILIPKPYTTA